MSFNRIARILIILSVISQSACEDLNSTGEMNTNNSVVFILTSGLEKQKIYFFRTLKNNEGIGSYPYGILNDFINEGATIKIDDGRSVFSDFVIETYTNDFNDFDSRSTKYYVNASKFDVLPSTVYNLDISYEGEEISGSAKTPGSFKILNLPPRDTLFVENRNDEIKINIKWSESKNAAFYSVIRRIAMVDSTTDFRIKFDFDFPFSGSPPIGTQKEYLCSFPSRADSIRIDVVAYDQNTYAHLFDGKPSKGLINALGVFGAATVSSETIIIQTKK